MNQMEQPATANLTENPSPQQQWRQVIENHLAKRPNAWAEAQDSDGGKIIFSKIPEGTLAGAQAVQSIVFTERGAVRLQSMRKYIDQGRCGDWNEGRAQLLLTISRQQGMGEHGQRDWVPMYREEGNGDSVTHVLPVRDADLPNVVRDLHLAEDLDRAEEYYKKKAEQAALQPKSITEIADF